MALAHDLAPPLRASKTGGFDQNRGFSGGHYVAAHDATRGHSPTEAELGMIQILQHAFNAFVDVLPSSAASAR